MWNLRCGALLALAILGIAGTAVAETVWYTNLNDARREAERLDRPILCHFGAKWCGPCRQMEAQVLNKPAVINALRANVVAVKIDADEHPELVQRFGIDRYPTDVFVEPNGRQILVSPSALDLAGYQALIARASSRYSQLVAARNAKPSPPIAAPSEFGGDSTQLVKQSTSQLMIEGFCPVTLQTDRKWEKGTTNLAAQYKGLDYRFASAEAKDLFQKNPEKYIPQYLGCDPVILWDTDRAVPGSIEFAAFYDNQLYLFSSDENRKKFKATPDKFIAARVVLHLDQLETVIR